jgi:hypothetical protein
LNTNIGHVHRGRCDNGDKHIMSLDTIMKERVESIKPVHRFLYEIKLKPGWCFNGVAGRRMIHVDKKQDGINAVYYAQHDNVVHKKSIGEKNG